MKLTIFKFAMLFWGIAICAQLNAQRYSIALDAFSTRADGEYVPAKESDKVASSLDASGNGYNIYASEIRGVCPKSNSSKNRIFAETASAGNAVVVDLSESPNISNWAKEGTAAFAMYEKAVAENKRKVGKVYKIRIEKIDAKSAKLFFEVCETRLYFNVSLNVFSDDTATAVYSSQTKSFEKKFSVPTTMLIEIEAVCAVVDSTPIAGDIPLIGRLFQTQGHSRQRLPSEILSIEYAEQTKAIK